MAEPLDQIAQLIASIRALTAATHQNSATQADAVALMEKNGGESDHKADDMAVARAVVALIKEMPAPQVNVEPAAVNVTVPPSAVTVQPATESAGQKWRVEIERASFNGPISAFIVTKQ